MRPVGRDVAEDEVFFDRVPDGPFGEAEPITQGLELEIVIDPVQEAGISDSIAIFFSHSD